jgi:hypothetical protein
VETVSDSNNNKNSHNSMISIELINSFNQQIRNSQDAYSKLSKENVMLASNNRCLEIIISDLRREAQSKTGKSTFFKKCNYF